MGPGERGIFWHWQMGFGALDVSGVEEGTTMQLLRPAGVFRPLQGPQQLLAATTHGHTFGDGLVRIHAHGRVELVGHHLFLDASNVDIPDHRPTGASSASCGGLLSFRLVPAVAAKAGVDLGDGPG